MSSIRWNRRTFMKLAGLTGASGLVAGAPFLASRARAGGGTGPTPRFLFIYGEGGWTPRATFMRPSFAPPEWGHWSDIMRIAVSADGLRNTQPEPSEFEFDFLDPRLVRGDMSRVLDPFWDVRSKMLVLEGLAMLSTGWDPYGDGHAKNHLATSTCGPAAYEFDGNKSHAALPSIDQRILEHLKVSDPTAISFDFNPNPSRESGTNRFHYFLYKSNAMGGTDRVPTDGNPEDVVGRLFGSADPSTTDAEQRAMARRAVFAALQSQYRDLAGRMSGFDRARLETHRDLLDALDMRLGAPRPSCTTPMVPSITGMDRSAAYESDWNAFADMIALGFSCGLTQVASLSFFQIPPESYGLAPSASIHHEYEHLSDPTSYYTPEGGNVGAEEGMIQRHLYQSRLVSRLVQRLDSIPDEGGTLLDNTIVLYVSEMANGNHGSEYCPFIVFGGRNTGAIRPGRYLKYRQDVPNPWDRNYSNEHTGTPHTGLYVQLLRGMGLDIDYFHRSSIVGTVPHLTGATTTTIDMSGVLPRVA